MMAKSVWRSSKTIAKQINGFNSNLKYSTTLLLQRHEPDFAGTQRGKIILSFLTYPGEGEGKGVKLDIDLPALKYLPYMDIYGHSHGLVCLSNRKDVFLCNPLTREIRELPPTIFHHTNLYQPMRTPGYYDTILSAVGFGYDPVSNDFKVLRSMTFRFFSSNTSFGDRDHDRYEVYNLSTNRWREIKSPRPVLGRIVSYYDLELYHEGVYYFNACTSYYNGYKTIIQAFDMSEEVFHAIPLPDLDLVLEKQVSRYDRPYYSYKLGLRNGSIVLLLYLKSRSMTSDENFVYVWVMEKDKSWSRILKLGPLPVTIHRPLLFVNSDELLMRHEDGRIVCYNIITRRFNDFVLKIDHLIEFNAFIFEKSLLSVRRGTCLPDSGVKS